MSGTVKLCADCNKIKKLGEFYKVAGKYYQSKCKLCHNIIRAGNKIKAVETPKKRRKTKFDAMDQKIKDTIVYDFTIGLSKKKISEKYNINYGTLQSWIKKGIITADEGIKPGEYQNGSSPKIAPVNPEHINKSIVNFEEYNLESENESESEIEDELESESGSESDSDGSESESGSESDGSLHSGDDVDTEDEDEY